MPHIQQLSPHVADLIAAGEVVERPGSVVKELVENSIDAGAAHVTVEIQNGGMSLIRVTDDGCGMEHEDARTAFLRHATSKLRTAEDLAAIGTLGFRGEALAAISAVSRITLLTATGVGEGTSLMLEGGVITGDSPAGCPKGTTIIVKNLFYNTPARLKFMKTDMAEGANVAAAVQRLAIAHPEIAFRMLRDGQEILNTTGDGKLLSVIYTTYGRQTAKEMVPVESVWEKVSVSGFVSRPVSTRGNRNGQMFYVNGRYIKSKTLTAALEEAYRNQLLPGRFPACVLNLSVPLTMVDVNVHPAKTEVRFLSEKNVYDCVYYGVMAALGKASGRKDMTLPTEKTAGTAVKESSGNAFLQMTAEEYRASGQSSAASAEKPAQREYQSVKTQTAAPAVKPAAPQTAAQQKKETPPVAVPVDKPAAKTQSAVGSESAERRAAAEAISFCDETPAGGVKRPAAVPPAEKAPKTEEAVLAAESPAQTEIPLPKTQSWRVVGEVLDCYIIVEEGHDVLFIDKHAAHERILFEKLKAESHSTMAQRLLTPISVSPGREETAVLLQNRELLAHCGFDVEDFGDGALLLREIPGDVGMEDAESLICEMAADLLSGKVTDPEARRDILLHTMACKAAVKAGWHTEPAERDALVRQVMTRDDLKYCPHGRPICIRLSENSLRRQFKRS